MTITINHGVPATPYFLVAYPKRKYAECRKEDGSTTIKLTDEKTKETITAGYFGCFEVPVDRLEIASGISRLAYGCSGAYLKENLLIKYPELNKPGAEVEFWILKRR